MLCKKVEHEDAFIGGSKTGEGDTPLSDEVALIHIGLGDKVTATLEIWDSKLKFQLKMRKKKMTRDGISASSSL